MKRNIRLAELFALLTTFVYAANAQPVPVYTFNCTGSPSERVGPCPDGGRANAILQGSDGNFYGTAVVSSEGAGNDGGGTVFSLTPAGDFKLLYQFVPGPQNNYANGNGPGLLVQGPDGKLYGITGAGGSHNDGVVFRLNMDGSGFQVIHSFCSKVNCKDGVVPSSLLVGADGNLYGTTIGGGAGHTGTCAGGGCGAIFSVTPSTGAYKVVFSFTNAAKQGYEPTSLMLGPGGSLYGLSGPLFEFTPSPKKFKVAAKFPLVNGLPAIGFPEVVGPNGNIYGLYLVAGTAGIGVFEFEVNGKKGQNVQVFPFYNSIDGGGFAETAILGSDGNMWLCDMNGSAGYGDILSLSLSNGTLLQSFTPFSTSAAVGAYPIQIIQANDGTLWGTTSEYGDSPAGYFADGTVFSLNAGLPPR
jgi:uncharacterized repeat protein (TIGR03803 family)